MANDRNRREDDFSGADPGGQRDMNEEMGHAGRDDIRGIADEGDDDFEDTEELDEEEEE